MDRGTRRKKTEAVARRRLKRRKVLGLVLTDRPERWLRKTGTPCSCWMCGNPRKRYKSITVAEEKFAISAKEQERGENYFDGR